ncbi:FMN-binding negative transcriptional regulator [soil metagenome]
MYKLPYFTETNDERVHEFMKANPFATIISNGEKFPISTHIPLAISISETGKIIFTGHLMKHTDHHTSFAKNEQVLVIFHGPDCYVSASWYTQPAVASTWNYISVHAKGKITFTDEEATKNIIEDITNQYEKEDSPAVFKNLPEEYVSRLVKAIVGFTIEVESIDNVFKLSQNHDLQTQQNIIEYLQQKDSKSKLIASEMKKRINEKINF